MNTCDSCKYWKKTKTDYRGSEWLMGDCLSKKWLKGYHYNSKDIEPDNVIVEDDEGWGAVTGAKFGCIHWVSSDGERK